MKNQIPPRRIPETYKQLHVVQLKQRPSLFPAKKFPLSVGIKTAKYGVVLLTDADCVPASESTDRKDAGILRRRHRDRNFRYGTFHKRRAC